MEASNDVIVEIEDHVLKLGINRPEKKNALTNEMYGSLKQALFDAGQDPQVKSVLIYGTPEAFSSGNDLKCLKSAFSVNHHLPSFF